MAKFIKLTATTRKGKEYYFKPENFVFISVENGKTRVHLFFDKIGAKEIMVAETPEEINARFESAIN